MVTLEYRFYGKDSGGNDMYYVVLAGKSSESKPTTGIVSGSRFVEVNTGKTIGYLICAIAKLGLGEKIKTASEKELPDLPEEDGTYALQLVIADGEATLTWEDAT